MRSTDTPLARVDLRAPARAPAVSVMLSLPSAPTPGAVVTNSLSCWGPTGLVTCGDCPGVWPPCWWCGCCWWPRGGRSSDARSAGAAGVPTSVGGRHPAVWLLPQRVTLGAQEGDGRLEVLETVEGLVDGGETQVGDLVELAQRLEDGQADLVRVDLGAALAADGLLDALGEQRQVVLGDRAALTGLADADEDLGAAERLGGAGALHDRQARGPDRGEPAPALGALATAADARAVVGGAGVHDPGVGVPTERTVHLVDPLVVVRLGTCG